MPPTNKEDRVYQLTLELIETTKQKKDSTKAFSEEIKRIKEEIEEIIDEAGDEASITTINN